MALLAAPIIARAQTQITTGVIQGTVLDESGAVVAGAGGEVEITDGDVAKTVTGGSGGRCGYVELRSGR